MKTVFNGVNAGEAFFEVDGRGVLVNTATCRTREIDPALAAYGRVWWPAVTPERVAAWSEIATYAFTPQLAAAASSMARAHTVPKAVRQEAAAGLVAAARARVPLMTLVTARALASGGQLSYSKVQHIARRIDSAAAVQDPLSWQLWGGDASRRWITGMLSKRTLTASADAFVVTECDLQIFDDPAMVLFALTQAGDPFAVEALLYVEINNDEVMLWDAGGWTAYGSEDELDALADRLVEVDQDTALEIAAALDELPGQLVHLANLNLDETALAIIASFDTASDDWRLASHITAALAFAAEYTPEERAKNAGSQPRDKNGRFATAGAHGVMKSGESGEIRGVNPVNNYLLIESDAGKVYSIPSRDFEIQNNAPQVEVPPQPPQPQLGKPPAAAPGAAPTPPPPLPPLDLSKILAQPRALNNSPKAVLDRALPPLGPAQLRQVIEDYNAFIKTERQKNARKFSLGDEATALTPETSDVKPIYMAVVDHDDPLAVLDLIALAPAATTEATATTFRRVNGQWIRDDKVLQDLKSPTPPPVVTLNDVDLQSVLQQVDNSDPTGATASAAREIFLGANGELWAFTAAGDGRVGAAERLRAYWLKGKGAAKIRWAQDGAWTRCHRHLTKYVGPERSKGICSTWFFRTHGYWPGDHRNR